MSDYIPRDNVPDILRRLPVESLLRFRCVCKWWKQIIDSQSFKLEHLALQKPQFMVEYEEEEFLILDPRKLPLFDTLNRPVEDKTKRLHLVGTLHGIVCLYDDAWKLFLLWNPSIRKFSILRVPECVGQFDWTYDGCSYGTCAGFWIDPLNKAIKVVALTLDSFEEDEDPFYGRLYSSIGNNWKRVSLSEVQSYYTLEATPPVVIQGVAHWIAQYEYAIEEQTWFGVVVVSFDFVQERFDTIEALGVPEGWESPALCSCEGALSLVYMDPNRKCDIYLRKEGSWVHTFGIGLISGVSRVLWGAVQVEETRKNSRIVATMGDELVLFDSKTMRCRTLKKGIKDPNGFAMAYGYVESLLYVM